MSAILSPCGRYRYRLDREVVPGNPIRLLWVMANPSTADATIDDATIRKVTGFTASLGCGRFTVVNKHAFRATNPRDLHAAHQAGIDTSGGAEAVRHITEAEQGAQVVVVAWGDCLRRTPDSIPISNVLASIENSRGVVYCLGRTRAGNPKHPLMLAYSTPLEVFA